MNKPDYTNIYRLCDDAEARADMATREWDKLIQNLNDDGLWNDGLNNIADRLVRGYVTYEFLYPIVESVGAVKKGKDGGEFFNYEWSALGKIKTELLKLEEVLKITPQNAPAVKEPERKWIAADEYL